MKTFDLANRATFPLIIDDKENPQKVIFNDVSEETEIKVSIERDKETKKQFITKLPLPFLLELQNKIERINGKSLKTYRYQKSDVNPSDANDYKRTIRVAHIEISIGGEISLNSKDIVEVSLSGLKTVTSTKAIVQGGKTVSNNKFTISKTVFEKGENEEKVDLSHNYLIFDSKNIPERIEFMYGSQKVTVDADYILREQEDIFGVVARDENNNPVYGTDNAVVLPLKGATSCYLKSDDGLSADLTYFLI